MICECVLNKYVDLSISIEHNYDRYNKRDKENNKEKEKERERERERGRGVHV